MGISKDKLTFFYSGDVCIQDSINTNFCDNDLFSFIKAHDFRYANFEAPIINSGSKKTIKAGPNIYQDSSINFLLDSKLFNIFSLANNHIMDYGISGLENTIAKLRGSLLIGAGIHFEDIYKPLIINKNNIKIALISAGENQFGCATNKDDYNFGYAWIYSNLIIKNIIELKNTVDFIVVLPHAGLEMEILPLPEWRNLYKSFIDFGADLVIASHPHIIQPKEEYKSKFIYYSLGNFLFTSLSDDKRWSNALNLSCEFVKNNNKKNLFVKEVFTSNFNNYIVRSKYCQTIRFNNINKLLNDTDNYFSAVNKICLKTWFLYYKNYYNFGNNKIIFNDYFNSLPNFVKKIITKISYKYLKRYYDNEILLYHNISIETHRFAVERALKLLNNI